MKKLIKIGKAMALCAIAMATFSCSDEEPITSTVTVYPTMTILGERITVLTEGDSFTDPGITSFEGEEALEVETTGTVDTGTPGVYDIYYTSVNSDGFEREVRRTVIVLSAEPSSVNLEGTFFRNGNPNVVTRLADRVYTADNAGGLGAADAGNWLNVTFYNIDDETLYIPFQEDVSQSGIDVESISGSIISENEFRWVLSASATYGTAERIFIR